MKSLQIKQFFTLRTLYILTTLLIALGVGMAGGIVDILHTQAVLDAAQHLGYPLYFFTLLGLFKILGGVALLLPKALSKFREIAYYGFGFDFIFASFSHYSVGDPTGKVITPLILLVLLSLSFYLSNHYSLYKKSQAQATKA